MKHAWRIVPVLLLLASTTVPAQTSTETLLDGDVDHGFLLAPDVKLTEVNGDFASLAGAYGGWVIDRKLLVGAGVYTLAGGASSTDMTYGGGVVEYLVNPDSLVNFTLRGLVGGGQATVDVPFGAARPSPGAPRFHGRGFSTSTLARSESFLVAEPEANVGINISEMFRVGVGGGYRFVGGAGELDRRLDGFFAGVALKLSFF